MKELATTVKMLASCISLLLKKNKLLCTQRCQTSSVITIWLFRFQFDFGQKSRFWINSIPDIS